MLCPVCKNTTMNTEPLEGNLLTMLCPECDGHWIKSFQYWRWRDAQPSGSVEPLDIEPAEAPDNDSKAGKLCPECGRFLSHKPVGHDIGFSLDQCGNCGGMWFDQKEWDALRQRSMHTEAHMVFTDIWQARVRDEERMAQKRDRLKQQLGEADYQQMLKVGRWLDNHPQREVLLAVLGHDDVNALEG